MKLTEEKQRFLSVSFDPEANQYFVYYTAPDGRKEKVTGQGHRFQSGASAELKELKGY